MFLNPRRLNRVRTISFPLASLSSTSDIPHLPQKLHLAKHGPNLHKILVIDVYICQCPCIGNGQSNKLFCRCGCWRAIAKQASRPYAESSAKHWWRWPQRPGAIARPRADAPTSTNERRRLWWRLRHIQPGLGGVECWLLAVSDKSKCACLSSMQLSRKCRVLIRPGLLVIPIPSIVYVRLRRCCSSED